MIEIDARKLKVLLSVLQRAPVTEAEQIVCGEVVAALVALVEEGGEERGSGGQDDKMKRTRE